MATHFVRLDFVVDSVRDLLTEPAESSQNQTTLATSREQILRFLKMELWNMESAASTNFSDILDDPAWAAERDAEMSVSQIIGALEIAPEGQPSPLVPIHPKGLKTLVIDTFVFLQARNQITDRPDQALALQAANPGKQ